MSSSFQAGRIEAVIAVVRRELDQVRMPETLREGYEMLGHVELIYRTLEDLSDAVLLAQESVRADEREQEAVRRG